MLEGYGSRAFVCYCTTTYLGLCIQSEMLRYYYTAFCRKYRFVLHGKTFHLGGWYYRPATMISDSASSILIKSS